VAPLCERHFNHSACVFKKTEGKTKFLEVIRPFLRPSRGQGLAVTCYFAPGK